jgi:hypothetical protein
VEKNLRGAIELYLEDIRENPETVMSPMPTEDLRVCVTSGHGDIVEGKALYCRIFQPNLDGIVRSRHPVEKRGPDIL